MWREISEEIFDDRWTMTPKKVTKKLPSLAGWDRLGSEKNHEPVSWIDHQFIFTTTHTEMKILFRCQKMHQLQEKFTILYHVYKYL